MPESLWILPLLSGYRDKETQVFKITTDYTDTLEDYFKDNKTNKLEIKETIVKGLELHARTK